MRQRGTVSESVRPQARLASTLERRVASYAVAAGAAGVGLLALAQPAKADIVYTPANLSLWSVGTPQGPGTVTYAFDLNQDGVPDLSFWLHDSFNFSDFTGHMTLKVSAAGNNGVLLGALRSGYHVGPGEPFGPGGTLFAWTGIEAHCKPSYGCIPSQTFATGPWAGVDLGALGLNFVFDGETHYGYIRLGQSFDNAFGIAPTIEGFAYQTIPNQPLDTTLPEPGTLGLLALGSLGLGYWRRRKQGLTKSA